MAFASLIEINFSNKKAPLEKFGRRFFKTFRFEL